MVWTPLDFEPGVYRDDTPRAAGGFFVDADKIRFVRKRAQVIGGWEAATDGMVEGLCRGMFSWRANSGLSYAAIGTNTHLQVYYDGDIYDITPIVDFLSPTFNVTTVLGEAFATLSGLVHNLVEGQRFEIINASPASVGGVTLDGEHTVLSVLSSSAITFTAAPTSSAGPTSVTADVNVYLAPGLIDGLAGIGYGVGPYGGGDYGEPTDISVLYPRTWSMDKWGQNLLANPRGGAIYEWSPNFTQPELVTNGDFASGTGWTTGTGWTIGAGVATASAGTQSLLTTTISLSDNAYYLLEFNYTRTAGTLQPRVGTTAVGSALSAASGRVRVPFYTAAGALGFDKDTAFAGTIDNVSVKPLLNATLLPNAPIQNTCILVTPELILLAGGTIDADTGEFNPMQIRSSDTGDGDLSANRVWTISPANLARRWNLANGSRIARLKRGNGEVIALTDTSLYTGSFTTDTNTVYRWRLIADDCGLCGPNAVAVDNSIARWVTTSFDIVQYSGGLPYSLDCPIIRDFKENLSPSQQDKIYAFSVSQFGETWWLYPDFRDGNECSRYLQYNYRGNVWAPGKFDRTAWLDAGAFTLPLAVATDGSLYWQEKGKSADSSPLSWFLTTGSLNKNRGMVEVMGFVPDFEDMVDGCSMVVTAAEAPNGTPLTFGPYDMTQTSDENDVRANGYSPTLTFSGNSAPAFMRMGVHQADIRQTRATR